MRPEIGALITLVYGVAATLVFRRGRVFARLRKLWPTFLDCPLCVGVWVGGALRALALFQGGAEPVFGTLTGRGAWVCFGCDVVGWGAATGVLALVSYLALDLLDSRASLADREWRTGPKR